MKLAVSNLAWNIDEESAAATLLRERSVRYIEVAPTKVWANPASATAKEIAAYKKLWSDQGFDIVALQSLLFGRPDLVLFGDRAARERLLAYLTDIIQLAAKLGATRLVFGSPKNRVKGNLTDQQAMSIAAEFFSDLGRVAYQAGLIMCIEPNAPQYGCDFVTTAAAGADLVERVASPGFGLHLDSACMALAGDLPESITKYHPKHFHISAPNLGPVRPDALDYEVFAGALNAIKYDGFVSIEMKPENTGNLDRTREAVEMSLATFK